MENNNIIAITIGPIYDTMQLVTKPAGLWGASYLFSYISCQLTEKIKEKYPDKIITPYFEFDEPANALRAKGVGYYHDHILVRGGEMAIIKEFIKSVKHDVANLIIMGLSISDENKKREIEEYIDNYLQIYAVEVEQGPDENAIQATSKYLDGMELQKQFVPVETENYIASFLDNEVIKDSRLVADKNRWMLWNGEKRILRDLVSIARSDAVASNEYKRYEYYALVNSDGDRMGELIKRAGEDKDIRSFSLKCMKYTTAACNRILDFGGIVVYAGGDDLQFLAPLTHGDGTIFDLLEGITYDFKEIFVQGEDKIQGDEIRREKPSVSFGVEIVYKKFPLYEALSASYGRLHAAKEKGRDAAVIRLQKHSGQTAEILIKNLSTKLKGLNDTLRPVLKEQYIEDIDINSNPKNSQDPLKSIISHISECKAACEVALISEDSEILSNYIDNTFDNPGQEKWNEYLKNIKDLMLLHKDYQATVVRKDEPELKTEGIIQLMRILQFFGEKGKEDYKDE